MTRHGRLAADLNEIFDGRRAGDADLRHDHAAWTKADIVADLHQVIDACPSPDHGGSGPSTVYGRVGADGDECADTTARTDLGARFDYRVGPISGDASPRASGSTSAKA